MDHAVVARALHLLGVVLWIGGVGFVTTVLLPAVRRMKSAEERVAFFEAVESRFAWQARVTTLLVGGTGLYLVERWNLWDRFQSPAYWWMHAMLLVWLLFTVMLFIAEPLFLHRRFLEAAKRRPDATFRTDRTHALGVAGDQSGNGAGRRGWESRVGVLTRLSLFAYGFRPFFLGAACSGLVSGPLVGCELFVRGVPGDGLAANVVARA